MGITYMNRQMSIQNQSHIVGVPDACPICHHHSEYMLVFCDPVGEGNTTFQIMFRCGYQKCRYCFICEYRDRQFAEPVSIRPLKPNISVFPDAVAQISPTFISVFAEAEEAKELGLSQIAGPGYRKAFEFLIKDYAKSLAPDQAAEIEKKLAGVVVNEHIKDVRIQAVAKRALWLGNDETHYLRKWAEKDTTDLVTLIKLTADWIEIGHLSKSYTADMPDSLSH